MANFVMKMFFIECLKEYDVVPVVGQDRVKLPGVNPRSVSTIAPSEDIQIVLVKRLESSGARNM